MLNKENTLCMYIIISLFVKSLMQNDISVPFHNAICDENIYRKSKWLVLLK